MFKPFLKSTVGVMAALCVSSVAVAQQDTTRIIVPFAAGGPIDVSARVLAEAVKEDRKSTRLNSSHVAISYAVFCLKKKKKTTNQTHSKQVSQSIRTRC